MILSLLGISKLKNRQRNIDEGESNISHRKVIVESDQDMQAVKEIPDYCPNCGTSLNEREPVQYCPYCGITLGKINKLPT